VGDISYLQLVFYLKTTKWFSASHTELNRINSFVTLNQNELFSFLLNRPSLQNNTVTSFHTHRSEVTFHNGLPTDNFNGLLKWRT